MNTQEEQSETQANKMAEVCGVRDATQTAASATQAATEAPATQAATEAPATHAATEAPATQAATEAPATHAATEVPATQAATEVPATPEEDQDASQHTKNMLDALQTLESDASQDVCTRATYFAATTVFDALEDEQAAKAFKLHGGAQTLFKALVVRKMVVDSTTKRDTVFRHVLDGLDASEQVTAAKEMLGVLRCNTCAHLVACMLMYFIGHSDVCAAAVAEADGMPVIMKADKIFYVSRNVIGEAISNILGFRRSLHTFIALNGIDFLKKTFAHYPSLNVIQNIVKCLNTMTSCEDDCTAVLIKQKVTELQHLCGEVLWWLIDGCTLQSRQPQKLQLQEISLYHGCVRDLLGVQIALYKISDGDARAGVAYNRCAWSILQTSDKWPSSVLCQACMCNLNRKDDTDCAKGSDALVTNQLILNHHDTSVFIAALRLHRALTCNSEFKNVNETLSKEDFAGKLIFHMRKDDLSFDQLAGLCRLVEEAVYAEPFVQLGGVEAMFACLDAARRTTGVTIEKMARFCEVFLRATTKVENAPHFWDGFDACKAASKLTNMLLAWTWTPMYPDMKQGVKALLARDAMRKNAMQADAAAQRANTILEYVRAAANRAELACLAKDEQIRQLTEKNAALTRGFESMQVGIEEAIKSSTSNTTTQSGQDQPAVSS